MNNRIFAPVIIPTLNRHDHLAKCLESLSNNHNAENTEVYVSVDYPPSEKYFDGYNHVCEYIDNHSFRFKKLHVYKQDHNLGVEYTSNFTNMDFLIDIVTKKYDRWIISEDDNVFSENFLDFMNECLEAFKDDPTVFCVSGYRFFYNLKYENNNFLRQRTDCNCWGFGVWTDKFMKAKKCDYRYMKKVVFNPLKLWKVAKVSKLRVSNAIGLSFKKYFKVADNFFTQYMIQEGMYQIMPTISKVRNIGWDESGIHCVGFDKCVIDNHLNQEIDNAPTFEKLKGDGYEYFEENNKIIIKEDFLSVSNIELFKSILYRIIKFWA